MSNLLSKEILEHLEKSQKDLRVKYSPITKRKKLTWPKWGGDHYAYLRYAGEGEDAVLIWPWNDRSFAWARVASVRMSNNMPSIIVRRLDRRQLSCAW